MEARKDLIKIYLSIVYSPSFNEFIQLERKEVINFSKEIETMDALCLQIIWVDTYNQCVTRKRPDINLQSRPEIASSVFREIFEIVKIHREINSTSSRYAADYTENKLIRDIGKTQASMKCKETFINLLSDDSRQVAFGSFSKEFLKNVMSKCVYFKFVFEEFLDSVTHKIISDLFNELKTFQFDLDTTDIIRYLDKEKNNEVNKKSEKYILLCIVSSIIDNFDIWKREDKFSEAQYSNKFSNIVDILFQNKKIYTKEGTNICEAIDRMHIINGEETSFDQRQDFIMVSEQDDKDIELCSLQFKRYNSIELVQQQYKNIQLNGCISNEVYYLTRKDVAITYLDFIGRSATVVQIFRVEDKFVIQKVGKIVLIKSLLELNILRETMLDLFRWKRNLINNGNIVSLAYVEESYR